MKEGAASLRILHLTDSLGAGGAERNLLTVLRHAPAGVENHIGYSEGDLLREDFEKVATVHRIGGSRFGWVRQIVEIRRLLRAVDADVVHTQLLNSTFTGRIAAMGTRSAVITTLQSAFYDGEDFGRFGLVRKPAVQLLDRVTALRNVGLVAVSEYVKRHFIERIGFPAERIEVIPNCLDPERVAPASAEDIARARASLGIGAGDTVLLHVGRLMTQKGQEEAIRALPEILRRIPTARLLLAGPGPDRARLEAVVRELALGDAVILAGLRSDIPVLLQSADLFVFPSRREGLSVALIEALAAGLPAVVCDIPQNREVGDGMVSVRFVPVRSPNAIATAALSLLGDARARASALESVPAVHDRFSPARLAERFFNLCERWSRNGGVP